MSRTKKTITKATRTLDKGKKQMVSLNLLNTEHSENSPKRKIGWDILSRAATYRL